MEKSKNQCREKGQRALEYISILSKKLKPNQKTEQERIIDNLKKAREEWRKKEIYFESVTDPDLVDHAIYELKASKIKYTYLLKKIKEGNIR